MEFRVFDSSKNFIGLVNLSPDCHTAIMKFAHDAGMQFVSQFKDYYGVPRKEIYGSDFDSLMKELVEICKKSGEDPEICEFAKQISVLINLANKEGQPILVVTE